MSKTSIEKILEICNPILKNSELAIIILNPDLNFIEYL